jgi:hypothetical protein
MQTSLTLNFAASRHALGRIAAVGKSGKGCSVIIRSTCGNDELLFYGSARVAQKPFVGSHTCGIVRIGIVQPSSPVSQACRVLAASRYVRQILFELSLSRVALFTHFLPSLKTITTATDDSESVVLIVRHPEEDHGPGEL